MDFPSFPSPLLIFPPPLSTCFFSLFFFFKYLGSFLLSPLHPLPNLPLHFYLFLFWWCFFRYFLAICSNFGHFRPSSMVLCRLSPPSAPPRANAGQCLSSLLLWLLFLIVVIFVLFVLNKSFFFLDLLL
jgi:hypothetical protein